MAVDIDKGKLIHPPELSAKPSGSYLVVKEKLAKEMMNIALRSIVHTSNEWFFNMS
jgi:hypothetical protein